jgi:hypothetical protein
MAMPEASVDEYYFLPAWEHQVRRTGKVTTVQPESKTEVVSQFANSNFGLGVLATNARHHRRTPFR